MASKYDGMFKLSQAVDENGNALALPPGKAFVLVLRSESDRHYALSLRLGNSLRSDMVVNPSSDSSSRDGVHIGEVMSTMMMPPEAIFRVETFLKNYLPKATNVYFEDDNETLSFEGQGKISFTRE